MLHKEDNFDFSKLQCECLLALAVVARVLCIMLTSSQHLKISPGAMVNTIFREQFFLSRLRVSKKQVCVQINSAFLAVLISLNSVIINIFQSLQLQLTSVSKAFLNLLCQGKKNPTFCQLYSTTQEKYRILHCYFLFNIVYLQPLQKLSSGH